MHLPGAHMRFQSKDLRYHADIREKVWNRSPDLRSIVFMQGVDPPRQDKIRMRIESGYAREYSCGIEFFYYFVLNLARQFTGLDVFRVRRVETKGLLSGQ